MQTKTIPLNDADSDVRLEAYWLNNSPEFQTDRRRPAVVICPGGGYMGLSDREAEPIALRFLARGYHAFVLRYSVQTRLPAPMLELAKAVALVRENAPEWRVDPDQVIVVGFSAGGHLAASLGVLWNQPLIHEPLGVGAAQVKPNAMVLGYPVIELEVLSRHPSERDAAGQPIYDEHDILTVLLGDRQPSQAARDQYRLDLQVSPAAAPAFIWHTAEDAVVPADHSLRLAAALARHNVPFELHIFERGEHGLALADEVTEVDGRLVNPACQVWVDLALTWLKGRREKNAR